MRRLVILLACLVVASCANVKYSIPGNTVGIKVDASGTAVDPGPINTTPGAVILWNLDKTSVGYDLVQSWAIRFSGENPTSCAPNVAVPAAANIACPVRSNAALQLYCYDIGTFLKDGSTKWLDPTIFVNSAMNISIGGGPGIPACKQRN